jgi:hypothetical protein
MMSEETKSLAKVAGVLAVVLVLIVAAIRYFGGESTGETEAAKEDDGSPYVIRSIPTHAKVFLNNELAGTTPLKYESFESGILRIRLEFGNLAPVETLLIVRENAPNPTFPPFIFSIPVELVSVPPGAQPVVNGRPLRPFEIASYRVPATDTLEVTFELGDESSEPVLFNPIAGIVDEVDTLRWHWEPASEADPARLVGVFAAQLRVSSDPPGAQIFLDNNPEPIGTTNGRVNVPYGDHMLTLRLAPFDDYTFPVSASQDRSEPVSVVLNKAVWIAAVDAQNPFADLNARVSWVKQGEQYLVNPDDDFETPRNLLVGGKPTYIQLSCEGFADTTILLDVFASEATVAMRRLPRKLKEEPLVPDEEMGWVRFVVKESRSGRVAGAEVYGVDKDNGRIVRFGPTDEEGMLTTRVPIGDYDWWAAKSGYTAGKPNGERVKGGRKTKEITLKIRPL